MNFRRNLEKKLAFPKSGEKVVISPKSRAREPYNLPNREISSKNLPKKFQVKLEKLKFRNYDFNYMFGNFFQKFRKFFLDIFETFSTF